ncbi:peptidase inhibitor family I36 protein [Streptomyces ochraceiscleroticus]|uniref:Peptidase inhibitor family I36 protein n=1 Tax=Streptomyces ochraceiscleroticus TaxID=47761 RepID=A0ABW1MFF6_9ACTN|nr:peptidase inhibitor family I36 protein [Streptomyces ochraceiscleroticus]
MRTTLLAATAGAAVLLTTAAAAAPAHMGPGCAAGQLCLWPKGGYEGPRETHELSDTDIESCVPLPDGRPARSFVNRTGRPVTTFQSAECAETGEFDTYPGGGTYVPDSPYAVRAFRIAER